MKGIKYLRNFSVGMFFVLIFSIIPYIYKINNGKVEFTPLEPFNVLYQYIIGIQHFQFGTYQLPLRQTHIFPVFPNVFQFYLNSMLLLLASIILGVIIGFLVSIGLLFIKKHRRRKVLLVNYFFMSIPDFIIFLILQALVVWIYMETGITVGRFYSLVDRPAILLPIISLAIPVMIYIARISIDSFHEIYSKEYILFAYAKGLSKMEIIIRHITRNAIPMILSYLPKILQMGISNLFLVEIIYNIRGIMWFIGLMKIEVVFPSLTLIWITYFLFSSIAEKLSNKLEVNRNVWGS